LILSLDHKPPPKNCRSSPDNPFSF
jgi:hypothetical protein